MQVKFLKVTIKIWHQYDEPWLLRGIISLELSTKCTQVFLFFNNSSSIKAQSASRYLVNADKNSARGFPTIKSSRNKEKDGSEYFWLLVLTSNTNSAFRGNTYAAQHRDNSATHTCLAHVHLLHMHTETHGLSWGLHNTSTCRSLTLGAEKTPTYLQSGEGLTSGARCALKSAHERRAGVKTEKNTLVRTEAELWSPSGDQIGTKTSLIHWFLWPILSDL